MSLCMLGALLQCKLFTVQLTIQNTSVMYLKWPQFYYPCIDLIDLKRERKMLINTILFKNYNNPGFELRN